MRVSTEARIKIAVQKSGRLTDHSLELLVRCGLSYSRGKDQLICYGENMPVDVLLVRDDDIPRLVQEDICDLGIVGLNIIEERRLEMIEQGKTELFSEIGRLDFGQCRLSFGVPDGVTSAGRKSLDGKRIATTYPRILKGLSRAARRERADHLVLRRGGDRAEPRQGRSDLRSRVERLDAARAPALRGGNDSREPRRADPDARRDPRRKGAVAAAAAAAHPGRAAGQGEQIHHAARAAVRRSRRFARCCPAANRRRSFRSRAATTKSLCTPCAARTCSGRRSSSSRKPARARCSCCPSRRCWRRPPCNREIWQELTTDGAALRCSTRPALMRTTRAWRARRGDHRARAARGRRGAARPHGKARRRRARLARGRPSGIRGGRATSLDETQRARDPRGRREHRDVPHARSCPAARGRHGRGRALRARARGRSRAWVFTCPAGNAPLPSTALMLGVPARLAGCRRALVQSRAGGRQRATRPCCMRRSSRACSACSSSAAHRRSRRWPTAPRRCRRSTRSSVPATLGDRGQGTGRPRSRTAPRATIRPGRPRCS